MASLPCFRRWVDLNHWKDDWREFCEKHELNGLSSINAWSFETCSGLVENKILKVIKPYKQLFGILIYILDKWWAFNNFRRNQFKKYSQFSEFACNGNIWWRILCFGRGSENSNMISQKCNFKPISVFWTNKTCQKETENKSKKTLNQNRTDTIRYQHVHVAYCSKLRIKSWVSPVFAHFAPFQAVNRKNHCVSESGRSWSCSLGSKTRNLLSLMSICWILVMSRENITSLCAYFLFQECKRCYIK